MFLGEFSGFILAFWFSRLNQSIDGFILVINVSDILFLFSIKVLLLFDGFILFFLFFHYVDAYALVYGACHPAEISFGKLKVVLSFLFFFLNN